MTPKKHLVPAPIRWGARLILKLLGWRAVGDPNRVPKAVIIAAPHTSNWDGFFAIIGGYAMDGRFRWMGKKSLFRFPLGLVSYPAGGIPIDRSSSHNVVEQMIEVFNQTDHLSLIIAPEATRKQAQFWKTGFYHIALGAQVPLMLGYVDYAKKEIGVATIIEPSGDIEADMLLMRDFFQHITPKHPESRSEVRLQTHDDI